MSHGKCLSPAADIWAVGLIIVELISGKDCFTRTQCCQGSDGISLSIGSAVRHALIENIQDVVQEPMLGSIVRACLSKDPSKRPTAAHLAELLSSSYSGASACYLVSNCIK